MALGLRWNSVAKRFSEIDQCRFPLALAGDFTHHPDHLWPAMLVVGQAAVYLQPVQAAVRPADAVAHGALHRLAVENRLEHLAGTGAVLFGQQVEVIGIGGQRALGIEAEQRLGTA